MTPWTRKPERASGTERETVLVVGNYLPSLTVVRSLAAAGYRVVAGDGGEFSTVAYSRHCHEVWAHPPVRRAEDFLAALATLLAGRPDITTLLPLQERYVALLATELERLPADVVVAMPDPATVLTCLDKERMVELAREAGVPCRPTALATDLAGLATAADALGYPSVVRPASGASLPLPGDRKAVIARDRSALERAFPAWPEGHPALIVQPYVEGPRHNVYFAAREGRILAVVESRIIRTDRPDGTGLAVEAITVPPDPRLERHSEAIISRLGYTGIGLVQFIVPEADDPHFLEINPRHGAAGMALVKDCGLDLTRAAIDLAAGADRWQVEAGSRSAIGQRFAWTTGDLHALRIARTGDPLRWRDALRWLTRTTRAAIAADVHATWSWSDPLPTLMILAQWLPFGRWKRMPLRDRSEDQAHPTDGPAPGTARPVR